MNIEPLTIVIAIVAVIVVGVAGYYIARYLRGTIKLELPRTAYNPGDTISGKFELITKKPIEGKSLVVSLIGTQHVRDNRKDKNRTRTHEIYRNETVIEEARDYEAGTSNTYEFEIPTPDNNQSGFMDSELGKMLTTTARVIGNRRVQYKWRVEARLKAKGIDLAKSRRIRLNMKQGLF